MNSKASPPALSDCLFWDVDLNQIDPDKHSAWLTRRVLEYGDWSDWQALVDYFGKDRLADIATSLRTLQPKSLAFCQVWFNLPKHSFRCFTNPPSL